MDKILSCIHKDKNGNISSLISEIDYNFNLDNKVQQCKHCGTIIMTENSIDDKHHNVENLREDYGKCRRCGSEINERDVFCRSCGTPVKEMSHYCCPICKNEFEGSIHKILHDPIEYTNEYKKAYRKVERQIKKLFPESKRGLGCCHAIWSKEKELLLQYGIDWKTPSEMNPGVMFD